MLKSQCPKTSISACGPKICWVCPHPNYERNWTKEDEVSPNDVDQIRKNIYYGGVICDFKPRSEINDYLCNRTFLNTPSRPPQDYAGSTDVEFYLRHGQSSGCSPFWKQRYDNIQNTNNNYERIGPAPF